MDIPHPLLLQNAEVNAILPVGASIINTDEMITCKHVVVEGDGLGKIKYFRDSDGTVAVTDEEMCYAISRYLKILLRYSGVQITSILNLLRNIDDRMERVDTKIDGLTEAVNSLMENMNMMNDKVNKMTENVNSFSEDMNSGMRGLSEQIMVMNSISDANNMRMYNACRIHDENFFIRPLVKYKP